MKINRYKVHTSGISETFSVMVISDSHDRYDERWFDGLHPDMIAVVGDFILGSNCDGRPDGELWNARNKNAEKLLGKLRDIAPVYLSIGNHEHRFKEWDIQFIKDMGITVLDDEFLHIKNEVVIGGLTSGLSKSFRRLRDSYVRDGKQFPKDWKYALYHQGLSDEELSIPDSGWLDDFENEDGFKILLSHHPEYWSLREPFLERKHIDLVLSGHAHGGQMRFFGQGIYAPGQGILPKYTKGRYDGDDGCMIVSAGMSNTYRIPRLFNPPEIVWVDVVPE